MAIKVTPLRVIGLILGLLIAVGVTLYALGINPLDRFCRRVVAEAATLPDTVNVSTCQSHINNSAVSRFFTATVSEAELRVFMTAQGLPEDIQTAALQSLRIDWDKDGGKAAMGWADGVLSYSFQRN
jgi:hypothetical protein